MDPGKIEKMSGMLLPVQEFGTMADNIYRSADCTDVRIDASDTEATARR